MRSIQTLEISGGNYSGDLAKRILAELIDATESFFN